MTITTQSTYTKFQEWLADCPPQIEDYQHNVDNVVVRFDLPLEGESNNNSEVIWYD